MSSYTRWPSYFDHCKGIDKINVLSISIRTGKVNIVIGLIFAVIH